MSTSSILFPHLGITLPSVGRFIHIGSFEIAYYGIAIAFGMVLGVSLILRIARWSGQDEDQYLNLCMLVMALSIVGARLYYCIFKWEDYRENLLEILDIRGGGLAIYGGILTGILTIFVYAKKKHLSAYRLLDTIVPGLVVGQILGRWGNFFNREAFGRYTDGLFAMALPKDAVYQSDITTQMLEHIKTIGGVDFIQVHPTFLYESVWNVGILPILLLIWKKKKTDGTVILTYLLCYGIGRMMIESLRTDQLFLTGTKIPVSMAVSGVLICFSAGMLLRGRRDACKTDNTRYSKKS